jgi:acyl-CoA hydrolase
MRSLRWSKAGREHYESKCPLELMTDKMRMSFLAEPTDVNFSGKVHGGEVMRWIDQAGYAFAVKYSRGYAVTKWVDNIEFVNPMHIGDLVHIETTLMKSGNTSMTFHVKVGSENLKSGARVLNCQCDIVFVAVDASGNKRILTHA